MKTFNEFLADLLFFEMAFDKKTMENKIRGLEQPINIHLVKLIRYQDKINKQKYVNDVMTWLADIQDLNFNKKDRKFSKDLYFKLLFKEPITDSENISYIKNLEARRLRDYSSLPRMHTELETLRILENLHQEISKLLSQNAIFDIESTLESL